MLVFWQAKKTVYEDKTVGFWVTLRVSSFLIFLKKYKCQYVMYVSNF